ncbi:Tol-Pal system beta propeller repeat protein TolB [Azonexus sp.]|jgi:TolB protein|uniref:Tol-Pal system beta propeller repeat protein TolB n=1 Tax=Azonexus sp. TaxID=1872668 RepID=UPI0028333EFF|nr:Tol-Pal system beta propeller repeat protein TolB [Azonexus sp.]MDR1994134.1 Tol-Pal system beta propeller repeat protein TolB [Azonexus sp.]
MNFRPITLAAAGIAGVVAASAAYAQLSIEITGAGANRIPVAVADFGGDQVSGQELAGVVRADLERSGLFRLIEAAGIKTGDASYGDWQSRGVDALVDGNVTLTPVRMETSFRLYDIQKQAQLGGLAYGHQASQIRPIGHRIADYVYEKLTGEPGVFATRIAYVVKVGARYELQIADADGGNAQAALASREPIISPSWSPDGSKLAYVSFEAKKPIVYVHDIASGRRYVAANFKGSNSAPAWSPDGSRLVIVLTKDGNSQIYTINADGSGAIRLASSSGIDTEPQYSPDGEWIFFTSDRGGSPQIYRIPATGGFAQRITFDGQYNVTPRPSPDGKSLAYISRQNGNFQLTVMDLATRQIQILTDSSKDESPSYAPNSRMILYATEIDGRGVLAAVSADGRVKQRLSIRAADIREPAWGPFGK